MSKTGTTRESALYRGERRNDVFEEDDEMGKRLNGLKRRERHGARA